MTEGPRAAAPEPLYELYRREVGADGVDGLTGLANRGAFGLELERCVARAAEGGPRVAIALLDVDLLRAINQAGGLLEGDRIIRAVSTALAAGLRPGDVAGRLQGGLFGVVLPGVTTDDAVSVAERLRNAVNEDLGGRATVSAGISGAWEHGAEALLAAAEASLRRAKMKGATRLAAVEEADRTDPTRVAVVDDDVVDRLLLSLFLEPLGCEVLPCSSGEELLALSRRADLDLVLLDVMMPELNGFEVCRRLKASEETRQIPVVLVTALNDTSSRVQGIEAGADDFLTKPPNREELIARVRSLIRVRRLNRDYATIESVLFSLANAVEAKDRYTRGHTDRVRSLAVRLGTRLGLSRHELTALDLGGALHDIGKIGVPGHILNKAGPLDETEWGEMKTHTELGYRICLPLMRALGPALDIVRYHHEKLDGSSYPDGLRAERIGKLVRIMTIVDIYDALVTDRPYRAAMGNDDAFRVLRQGAAEGELDGGLVEELVRMLSDLAPSRSGDHAGAALAPTVLVVDDDPVDTRLVRTLLRVEGMRVIECTRLEDGLRLARNHHPDLVLVDANADGGDLSRVRADTCLAGTPVVALGSGASQAVCDARIERPIDSRTFVASLRAMLRRREGV